MAKVVFIEGTMPLLGRTKKIRWHITSGEDSRWDSSGISTVGMIFQMPTKAKAWTKNCEKKYGKRPKDLEYSARKI